ncbi:MAG TPA: transglycosylase domain-containing protein, partial [Bacilli bacterium]|nr:transglycosylase domain-containing protein [Bacilli bacterium]
MKVLKKIFKILLILLIILIIIYLSLYLYAKSTNKLNIKSANNYYMYDSNNELFSGHNEDWINIDKISKHLINATLSIEDKNFYKHIGFDYLRILKALFINAKNGKTMQGASTISQQYAKNLYLDFDKTWKRKFEEAWLTIKLESTYSKDEILEGYLNTINYGGVFGIENASYYYFGISASELSLAQASILAGIPKSPTNYSPITNLENAKKRQLTILKSMVKNKYITEEELKKSYEEELTYIGKSRKNESSTIMYYQDAVMDELENIDSIPDSLIETGGLKIYTNLNTSLQLELEKNFNKNMTDENLQVSSIIAEPTTGKIVSLIGGRDYSKSQYNRATKAKRQVGSSLKPFLYYSALENGFTASTTFSSSKTTFILSNNQTYSPKNYGDVYGDKEISMAAALAYSDNIYAVKTNLFLGEDNLVNILHRVGIDDELKANPSLALGTAELTMYQMIKAYSTLASYGNKITPHLIEKVTDNNDKVLYEYKYKDENVLNKSSLYIINELLTNCYNTTFIDYNYPTCINIASKVTHKYSIKTGTTDTDNLIFGYNKDLVMGIWTGFDNNANTYSQAGSMIKNT